jgi:hypothetical protein
MTAKLLALALLAACEVGEAPPGGVVPLFGDASVTLTDAAESTGGGSNCRAPVTTNIGDGHHNAGQDCMNSCHAHGFTLAGTLYSSSAGTSPIAGGTIVVTDAQGHTFDVVSQANGNFYTTQPVAFPVTVMASDCPSTTAMASSVSAGAGGTSAGCNANGCHQPGGGQGPIHLP